MLCAASPLRFALNSSERPGAKKESGAATAPLPVLSPAKLLEIVEKISRTRAWRRNPRRNQPLLGYNDPAAILAFDRLDFAEPWQIRSRHHFVDAGSALHQYLSVACAAARLNPSSPASAWRAPHGAQDDPALR